MMKAFVDDLRQPYEGKVIGETRLGFLDGAIYAIRDVWNDDGTLATCEYATPRSTEQLILAGASSVVWRECEEGVDYEAIRPLVTAGLFKQ